MTALRSSSDTPNSPREQFKQCRLLLFTGLLCDGADLVLRLIDRHAALRQLVHEVGHLRVLSPVVLCVSSGGPDQIAARESSGTLIC